MAPSLLTFSDLERSKSRSLRFQTLISRKGAELGPMLLLTINRKPYMASPSIFKIKGRQKSEMHSMTQIELHATFNSQKYSIYILTPEAQILVCFARISSFWDTTCTRSAKIGNAPNDPKLNLNTLQSKVLYVHYILIPEVQILVSFALWLTISEICTRSAKIGNAPNDPKLNLNT